MFCWLRRPRPQKCRAGCGRQREPRDLGAFVPVELAQPVRRHPPALQVGADAERDGEDRVRTGQLLDGRQVEVVVVVVRDHHDVDRPQRGQRYRYGV